MSETEKKEVVNKSSETIRTENEIVQSDRIDLVNAANDLVETLSAKQIMPMISDSMKQDPLEFTEQEQAAYNSALSFLETQFDASFNDSKSFEKSREVLKNCNNLN